MGFDRRVSAEAVGANKKVLDKYSTYHYNRDGTLIVTDDWTDKGKIIIPKQYKSFAVIETIEIKKGVKYRNRTIYDSKGNMVRQVHSGPHANPKLHPYGKNGEHIHEYEWEGENIVNRISREITDIERKENADIL